jgi:hypothetical protein
MRRIGLFLLSCFLLATFTNWTLIGHAAAQAVPSLVITEIGQMETAGWAANVQVQNNVAYVSASDQGLYAINISDPRNPAELGRYNVSIDHIHDIYVDENLAYLADYTEGFKILDVSDPENLTLIGEFNDGGEVGALEIYGSFAFLVDFQDGLEIVNITDAAHPEELTQYDTGLSYVFNVEVIDDYAYVSDFISASEKALIILDISNLSSIEEVARYAVNGEIFSIEFVGDVAYMMCSYGGVKVFNVSNPESLVEMGSFYDGGNAVDSEFYGDYMAIADRDDGLEVLDVGSPINIVKIGNYFDGGSATNIAVVNDLVFVADGTDGLEILHLEVAQGSIDPFFIGLVIASAGLVVLAIILLVRYRKK